MRFFFQYNGNTRNFIDEPVGFSAFASKVKQGSNRWGRDKMIGGDDAGITIWNIIGRYDADAATLDKFNHAIGYLTHGFDVILDLISSSNQSFESEIYFGMIDDDDEEVLFQIDTPKVKTDEYSYINFNIIRNSALKIIESRADTPTDVYGSVDLDGNAVTPLAKERFLLRAKSEYATSTWKTEGNAELATSVLLDGGGTIDHAAIATLYGVNNTSVNVDTEIETSLSWASPVELVSLRASGFYLPDLAFCYLQEKATGQNVTININNLSAHTFSTYINADGGLLSGSGYARLAVYVGASVDDPNLKQYTLWQKNYNTLSTQPNFNLPTDFSITIPQLAIYTRIFIFLYAYVEGEYAGNLNPAPNNKSLDTFLIGCQWNSANVTINQTSTSVDTVINANKYKDVLKTGIRNISGLPLFCPDFEAGGRFENLWCTNGNGIRRKDKPLYVKFQDEMGDDLQFPFGLDYCISSDGSVKIGDMDYHYPDIELMVLDSIAGTDIEKTSNNRFHINRVSIKQQYNKDDRSKNTIDSFQTETDYNKPTGKLGDNKREWNLKHIWDDGEITKMKILAQRETTALESDDKLVMMDAIPLSPSAQGSFPTVTTVITTLGKWVFMSKSITNQDEQNFAEDYAFKWTDLGLTVGQSITINIGIGASDIVTTIFAITDTQLSLNIPLGLLPLNGTYTVTFTYNYTNVLWTNRFDEGFTLVQNSGTLKRMNMRYSMARGMENQYRWLSTIFEGQADGMLQNVKFQYNGALTTQFNPTDIVLREDENIPATRLGSRLLTSDIYRLTVACSFAQAKILFDGDLRGYVTVRNALGATMKVHIQECAMVWSEGILEITRGEVRADETPTTIRKVGTDILIQQAGYPSVPPAEANGGWFEILNGYLVVYSASSKQLIRPVSYRTVSVDGVMYGNEVDFVDAVEVVYG